jgi:hypothetical protein
VAVEKIRAEVIGPCPIDGVPPGGTVDLDPTVTNVGALVTGGHIRLSKTAAKQLDNADGPSPA